MITHGNAARTRVLRVSWLQLAAGLLVIMATFTLVAGALYHVVFTNTLRGSWTSTLSSGADESTQRDRFLRENIAAMAQKVGEMQAKLIKLEAVRDRVSGLAGIKPEEVQPPAAERAGSLQTAAVADAKGGPFIPVPDSLRAASIEHLNDWVGSLDEQAEASVDLFTLAESRLLEKKLASLMVPSVRPVQSSVGSGFGYRSDPFSGRAALHTGLDFPAETGTPIQASAGGVVLTSEVHAAYGQMVEIDHGSGLVTRYAHASKVLVHAGDIVKRGQVIALVGSTGRSTGAHLHFEVLVDGVTQDPAKFLAHGEGALASLSARQRRR